MTPLPVIALPLVGAGALPDVLLGYQQRLLTTTSLNPVTFCEKSRRIGATWGVAGFAVITSAASPEAGGQDTLYIGYNLDMAREFIATAGMWAKAFHYAAGEVQEFVFKDKDQEGGDRDIQAFRISFASGYEIVALSSAPRSFRGRQGFAIIDEAAFHDDLAGLMKAALAFLIWGGKVLVISSHNGADNAFNGIIEEIRQGKKPYGLERITFDDAVADGLYERVCLKKKETPTLEGRAKWVAEIRAFYGDDADEELDVIPRQGTGTFLPTTLVERRMEDGIPVVRWACDDAFAMLPAHVREAEAAEFCERHLKPLLAKLDPELDSYFGQDFARSGDLSVIWPIQVQKNLRRRPPFLVELRNVPFEQQKQILFYIARRLPRFTAAVMDATGNGAYLAEVAAQEFGFQRVAQVKLSEAWYREAMPKFKAAFEDGLTVLPRDADVLADHKAIKIVRGVPVVIREAQKAGKGEDAKKGGKRHGDSAIAHLLAYIATLTDVPDLGAIEAAGDGRAGADAFADSGAGGGWDDDTGADRVDYGGF